LPCNDFTQKEIGAASQKKELPSLNIGGEEAANTVVLNPLLLEYVTKQSSSNRRRCLIIPSRDE
jgi:hypothetical protein